MTSLLSSHLEQISLCSNSIASLPFQGPKIFTNALLNTHDITSLIRDTEAHERALFHLAPPPMPAKASNTEYTTSAGPSTIAPAPQRRATVYGGPRQPKNKAVAAVLGGDLYTRTRAPENARQKGEIDVEALLHGAEKLAAVYPIPGANDRISQLRRRHQQLAANIEHYEGRVALQTRELERMHRPSGMSDYGDEDEEMGEEEVLGEGEEELVAPMTKEDLMREEEEIRELERKKRGLEERVTGMERDLGGLMR